jgi:uncharacterized protein (DUF2062 family)
VLFRNDADIPSIATALEGKGIREWFSSAIDWLAGVGYPLLVGLPLLAVILAIAGYLLADWTWRLHVMLEWRRRQLRRAQQVPR